MNNQPIRLKPVVYKSRYNRAHQNTAQQTLLLKALQITSDPKKLREMIHVKTVADVYRTLDKLGMRKEYHEALANNAVSFDFMVKGIKGIAEFGEKDVDRLKAYQTLLKSVGLDKYDKEAGVSEGSWEDILMKKIDKEKKSPELAAPVSSIPVYEVIQPAMPESARKMQEEEKEMTKSVYDSE